MTQQPQNANDILMGGGGPPAWKFEDPGTSRTGTIASPPIGRQEREYDKDNPGGGALKVFPSGDPIMGVVVEVQTNERDSHDDDGRRTFYIEGRYIKEAVRSAVRAAGAPGLEVGGHLTVTFTHREDPMDKRSRKFWTVKYVPAGNAALMGEPAPAAPQQFGGPVSGFQGQPDAQGQFPPPVPAPVPAAPAPAATPPGMTPEQLAAFQQWQWQAGQQTAAAQ